MRDILAAYTFVNCVQNLSLHFLGRNFFPPVDTLRRSSRLAVKQAASRQLVWRQSSDIENQWIKHLSSTHYYSRNSGAAMERLRSFSDLCAGAAFWDAGRSPAFAHQPCHITWELSYVCIKTISHSQDDFDRAMILKIVTRLAWENLLNTIICVGASLALFLHSYMHSG